MSYSPGNNNQSNNPAEPELDNKPWEQLCEYALRCLLAERANSLVKYSNKEAWFVYSDGAKLLTDPEESVPAPPEMLNLLENMKPVSEYGRQSDENKFLYGWPIVVIPHERAQHVAPLFSVEIEAGKSTGSWLLHAVSEPELNLAIMASDLANKALEEEMKDALGSGVAAKGDKELENVATEVSKLLELTLLSELDLSQLSDKVKLATGIYNSAAFFKAPDWRPGDAVCEELAELKYRKDWRETAAAILVADELPHQRAKRGSTRPTEPLASPLLSNESMEKILERLRHEPLTVVTGPPGTGKTQLVANAVANAWLDGQTVLVTSTNNAAVDVAVERAEQEIYEGMLSRTGNHDERSQVPDRIFSVKENAESWVGEPENPSEAQARSQLAKAVREREELLKSLDELRNLDAKLLENAKALEAIETNLQQNSSACSQLPAKLKEASPAALAEKLQKVGRLQRTRLFRKWRIRRFLRENGLPWDVHPSKYTEILLNFLEWARLLDTHRKHKSQWQELAGLLPDPKAQLLDAEDRWHAASRMAVQSTAAHKVFSNEEHLMPFTQVGPGNPLSRAISRLLPKNILRGWACTTYSMKSNFGLKPNLFDLAILDEASQCSLAVVLPVAYRAKRLAVIGDPNQLRPVVKVGPARLRSIAKSVSLDDAELREQGMHFLDGSAYLAFESATEPELPALLNEHYRCHPTIARWFNRDFYRDTLKILTDVAQMSPQERQIFWIDVNGQAERNKNGGSWKNEQEAIQAVELAIIFRQQELSVAVLTPFAAQAELIRQLFLHQLGPSRFGSSGIDIGTAHKLQGKERDAIVFSTVLAPGINPGTVRWVKKERNLINVAVSRAKQVLAVVGHPFIQNIDCQTLQSLKQYCLECEQQKHNGDSSDVEASFRTDSQAELLLLDALREAEMAPYAKLSASGYELDFALMEEAMLLNLEVDGDLHLGHRARQWRQDLQRDHILENLGWEVMRIPAWRCHLEMDDVIAEIRKKWDSLLDSA